MLRRSDGKTMTVTVYSKPGCVQCMYTIKELDKQGVPHSVIDVTKDARAKETLEVNGFSMMPVVKVDIDESNCKVWSGLHIDKVRALAS